MKDQKIPAAKLIRCWMFGVRCSMFLPKLPVAFPNHPDAEQKIRDAVREHRVAKTVFADDQPLVGEAAKDSRQPLGMFKAENCCGHDERRDVKRGQRQRLKINFHKVAIQKRTEKNLFERRHNERRAECPHDDEHPGQRGVFAELLVWIPDFVGRTHLGIPAVNAHPHHAHSHAHRDGFPTERPAHFGNERAHLPNQPRPHECFGQIKPIRIRAVRRTLAKGQTQENHERQEAREFGRGLEFFTQQFHKNKIPNSNIQAPEKFQSSNSKQPLLKLFVSLVIGASLDVGTWNLELQYSGRLSTFVRPAPASTALSLRISTTRSSPNASPTNSSLPLIITEAVSYTHLT